MKTNSKQYKKLRKVKHVVRLLEETINQVLNNEIDNKKANTVGYLSFQIIKALEISEIEKRVEKIEKTLKLQEENAKETN